MHISQKGLRFIESFEGFVDHIYDDGTGVLTVGFGTTDADIRPLPHHVTRQQAEDLLRRKLAAKYEPAVRALPVKLNQNQWDALVSFAYNLGPGILGQSHTIGKLLHQGRLKAAADAMLMYDDPGTNVTAGLLRRRKAERALFLKPVPLWRRIVSKLHKR